MTPSKVSTNPLFVDDDLEIVTRTNHFSSNPAPQPSTGKRRFSNVAKMFIGAFTFIVVGIVLLVAFGNQESDVEADEVSEEFEVEFTGIPIVVAHGMSDSCLSPYMLDEVRVIKETFPDSYVECIMIGETYDEEVLNTFTLTMNEQVDIFTASIKNNPQFTDGFRMIGISQGNLIIRGYVQLYSHLPGYASPSSWISIHGPITGVTAFPGCDASDINGFYCGATDQLSTDLAYTQFMQRNLAQANYFRDPMRLEEYSKTNFLPVINNENGKVNENVVGLDVLDQVVLVKGLKDTIVFPTESEWFGYFKDGSYEEIETFEETRFYKENLFGLKTLNEQGKIFFETTPGGHVSYSNQFLRDLITKYWK